LPSVAKPHAQEETQQKGGTGNDGQPNCPYLFFQLAKQRIYLLRPSRQRPKQRLICRSDVRQHSSFWIVYLMKQLHKLLLTCPHVRTRLAERSGNVWQTRLLEVLS
jgi:hypothetical protein